MKIRLVRSKRVKIPPDSTASWLSIVWYTSPYVMQIRGLCNKKLNRTSTFSLLQICKERDNRLSIFDVCYTRLVVPVTSVRCSGVEDKTLSVLSSEEEVW